MRYRRNCASAMPTYYKEEYVEAIHAFENFRRLHPSNKSVPYSIYMVGLCYYSQMLTFDRDPTYARAAVAQFEQLRELYPDSPYTGKALYKLSEAKRIIAENEFFIGQFYLQYKNYPGAINRFTDRSQRISQFHSAGPGDIRHRTGKFSVRKQAAGSKISAVSH